MNVADRDAVEQAGGRIARKNGWSLKRAIAVAQRQQIAGGSEIPEIVVSGSRFRHSLLGF
jgi:hypothetical protein